MEEKAGEVSIIRLSNAQGTLKTLTERLNVEVRAKKKIV